MRYLTITEDDNYFYITRSALFDFDFYEDIVGFVVHELFKSFLDVSDYSFFLGFDWIKDSKDASLIRLDSLPEDVTSPIECPFFRNFLQKHHSTIISNETSIRSDWEEFRDYFKDPRVISVSQNNPPDIDFYLSFFRMIEINLFLLGEISGPLFTCIFSSNSTKMSLAKSSGISLADLEKVISECEIQAQGSFQLYFPVLVQLSVENSQSISLHPRNKLYLLFNWKEGLNFRPGNYDSLNAEDASYLQSLISDIEVMINRIEKSVDLLPWFDDFQATFHISFLNDCIDLLTYALNGQHSVSIESQTF